MKNLKKILMALLLVAVMVSAVATVAIAEASYTGTVAEAQTLLDAARAAKATSGEDIAAVKSEPLKKLYEYLLTVNPEDEGYGEVKEAYNQMTFKVMHFIYGKIAATTTLEEKSAAIVNVHAYIAASPVIINGDETVVYSKGFKCETCGKDRKFTNEEFYNGITAAVSCPGVCAPDQQKLVYATEEDMTYKYADFEKALNGVTLDFAGSIVAYLYGMTEDAIPDSANYYDVAEARQKILDYLESINIPEYVTPGSTVYTGDVAEVAELIANVNEDSTFEELKAALAAAYSYLVETPVIPTTDEYYDFINNYNKYASALIKKLSETVNAQESVEDKIAVIVDFQEYLNGTEETDGTQLSETVVKLFNEYRSNFISEYVSAGGSVDSLEDLEASVPEAVYTGDLAAFQAKLTEAEALEIDAAEMDDAIVELYAFVSSSLLDPANAEYAATIERYEAIANAYVNAKFVAEYEKAEKIALAAGVVADFLAFINETPLCECVTDIYSELLADLLARSAAIDEAIDSENLPKYEAPAKEAVTSVKEVILSLLNKAEAAYAEYQTADADNKAGKLADTKKALSALEAYIKGNGIDDTEDYYETFIADYSDLRKAVVDDLLAEVDAAEESAKIALLENVKAYIETAPVLAMSIYEYNSLVAETVTDADVKAELTLDNVYFTLNLYIEAIQAENAEVDAILENAKLLAELDKTLTDFTDSTYYEYIGDRDAAYEIVCNTLAAKYVALIENAEIDEYAAIVAQALEYAAELDVQLIIEGLNEALVEEEKALIAYLATADQQKYHTVYESFFAKAEAFDNAEGFAAKAEAYKAMFELFWSSEFKTTELVIGDSYDIVASEYERVGAELEQIILAMINGIADPNVLIENLKVVYGCISAAPFSETVIEAYVAACTELEETDFAEYAEELSRACAEAVYVTPDGFSTSFVRINLALQLAYEKYGVNEKFAVAYNILSGVAGVDAELEYAPQVLDFATVEFKNTLDKFNEAKQRIADAIDEAFASDDSAQQGAVVEGLKDFITNYPCSKNLHDLYSEKSYSLSASYREDSVNKTKAFESLASLLNSYIASCNVNTKILNSVEKSRYQTILTLAEISEFVLVESAIDSFENLSGDEGLALIRKNAAADEIKRIVELYNLTDSNDDEIALSNIKFLFEEFLIKFNEEIKALDEGSRARQVAYVANYIVNNDFPVELVVLYKNALGIDELSAGKYEGTVTSGRLVDLLGKTAATKISGNSDAILAALSEAVKYYNEHSFSKTGLLSDISAKIGEIDEYIEGKKQEQITALEKKAKPAEQSYITLGSYNHEDGKLVKTSASGASGSIRVAGDDSNRYAELTRIPGSANGYLNVALTNSLHGFVIDLDVMSTSSAGLNFTLEFLDYADSAKSATGRVTEKLISFINGQLVYNYGNYSFENYKSGVDEPIVTTNNVWTHLTCAVDFETKTLEVLIDYVSIGKRTFLTANGVGNHWFEVRFQPEAPKAPYANEPNVTCFDNLLMYDGTAYRTIGKTMTAEEEFNNNVSAMLDETASVVSRARAYYAALVLRDVVGAESNEAKAKFDAFNAEEIVAQANEAALAELKALADTIDVNSITTSDKDEVALTIEAIKIYMESNRQILPPTSDVLMSISKMIIDVDEKNAWLSNLVTAVEHLGRFHRATSAASVAKHYNLFKTYYDLCELDIAENMAMAEMDAVCKNFIAKVAADITPFVSELTFEEYCDTYIEVKKLIHDVSENTDKIQDCIGFIKVIAADESTFESKDAYFAELVLKASENYDYVETYLSIIRNIVKAGLYDESVEGIAEALEVYEILDAEFSEILKDRQYATISSQLERYNNTSSYIEKAGICTYLENYIKDNNVDLSDAQGVEFLCILEIFKAELSVYKQDYEEVLVANTEAFIAIVEKMKTYVTYEELKPLYDEAMIYYYSMNVDSDNVRASVEVFTKYQDMITEWENDSAMFLGYVSELKSARRQAQKFRALVNCMNYVDGVSEDIEGMTAALKTYSEALAAYNADITPVNDELAGVSGIVSSLRTHSVSATVLAIIQSMMNK